MIAVSLTVCVWSQSLKHTYFLKTNLNSLCFRFLMRISERFGRGWLIKVFSQRLIIYKSRVSLLLVLVLLCFQWCVVFMGAVYHQGVWGVHCRRVQCGVWKQVWFCSLRTTRLSCISAHFSMLLQTDLHRCQWHTSRPDSGKDTGLEMESGCCHFHKVH